MAATARELQDFYIRFTLDAIENNRKNVDLKSDNFIVSPFSAGMLLGMVANGAEENTAAKIMEYLGVSDLNSMNELYKTLIERLPKTDIKSEVIFGNSLWYSDKLKLTNDYSNTLERSYSASMQALDFKKTSAVNSINKWIAATTKNNKTNCLKPLDSSVSALLLNTLYYKGRWSDSGKDSQRFMAPFKPAEPKTGIFHGTQGDKKVDMMTADWLFSYRTENERFTAITIFFGNAAFVLKLIMPVNENGDPTPVPALTPSDFENIISEEKQQIFRVSIPKFSINGGMDISSLLAAADVLPINGGWNMFTSELSGPLYMQQQTSLSIDESTATAVAVSDGKRSSDGEPSEYHLVIDRPFYFMVEYWETGTVLLSGLVADIGK